MIGAVEATALLVPATPRPTWPTWWTAAVFVGDTLFMPDVGTARADFPGGDAASSTARCASCSACLPRPRCSFATITRPASRAARWQTTVGEQRAQQHPRARRRHAKTQFVAMRQARDATLEVPTLILPSIQVNVRAGQLPPADDNGVSYLRIPLNALPVHGPARPAGVS